MRNINLVQKWIRISIITEYIHLYFCVCKSKDKVPTNLISKISFDHPQGLVCEQFLPPCPLQVQNLVLNIQLAYQQSNDFYIRIVYLSIVEIISPGINNTKIITDSTVFIPCVHIFLHSARPYHNDHRAAGKQLNNYLY